MGGGGGGVRSGTSGDRGDAVVRADAGVSAVARLGVRAAAEAAAAGGE